MVNPTDSQHVKSVKTNRISQQVESDAPPLSPDISVSFEITPEVIQGDDYLADKDADNYEIQGQVMSNVQHSIVVRRTRRNHVSPASSLLT